MTLSTRFNRWTICRIAPSLAAGSARFGVRRRRPIITSDNSAQFPSKSDLKSLTTSGSYLAARHASVERDAARRGILSLGAAHRSQEQRACWTAPSSPRSPIRRDIDEAVKLADRILTLRQVQPRRPARGRRARPEAEEIRDRAAQHQSVDPRPITDLVATLLSGWASYGAGDTRRQSPISTS